MCGGVKMTVRELDTLHSSDLERRNASMARLEQLGWVFSPRFGGYCSVFHPEIDDGHTKNFNHPDGVERAIRFASMAQARREAK